MGYLLLMFNSTVVMANNTIKTPSSSVVKAEDVNWGYLNPLRGDKSPGAAELWGDRTQNIATGMLVKFNKGFSSPPHVHNISYRGIVIDGLMHNDDPTAKEMWMPKGSFWTQPAGEDHITAASGQSNLIYLEIDSGPYLVKPNSEAFNNGEYPLNLHHNNLSWLGAKEISYVQDNSGVEISTLWGSNKAGTLGGILLKLPPRFNGVVEANADEFRAVIIDGEINYTSTETTKLQNLTAGSYFDSKGKFKHNIASVKPTLIYLRTNGALTITLDE